MNAEQIAEQVTAFMVSLYSDHSVIEEIRLSVEKRLTEMFHGIWDAACEAQQKHSNFITGVYYDPKDHVPFNIESI